MNAYLGDPGMGRVQLPQAQPAYMGDPGMTPGAYMQPAMAPMPQAKPQQPGWYQRFSQSMTDNPAFWSNAAGSLLGARDMRSGMANAMKGAGPAMQADQRRQMYKQQMANTSEDRQRKEQIRQDQMAAGKGLAAGRGLSQAEQAYYEKFPGAFANQFSNRESFGMTPYKVGNEWVRFGSKGGRKVIGGPVDFADRARQTQVGTGQGKVGYTIDGAELMTGETIRLIDEVINHPDLANLNPASAMMPDVVGGSLDLGQRVKQLEGQAFNMAYQALKGGGPITEVEGQAAASAIFRASKAQSLEAYLEALEDFKYAVQLGMKKLRLNAGLPAGANVPASAGPAPGGSGGGSPTQPYVSPDGSTVEPM